MDPNDAWPNGVCQDVNDGKHATDDAKGQARDYKGRKESAKSDRGCATSTTSPRFGMWAQGKVGEREKVGKAALAQQAYQHCHWLLIPEYPTASQPQKSMGRSATAQALPGFVLTVSHLPEGDGGPAILADCCQAFIRFPAQAGEKV